MAVYALGEHRPKVDPDAYVHPDAVVIGRVELGPGASVWPSAVLRGDFGAISIGARTSIQDGVVLHATSLLDTRIGSDCVIGHLAHLEGCVIEDGCLIGAGSILLHRVHVGAGALVAAGAVLTPDTEVPALAMARGVPARVTPEAVEPGAFTPTVLRYMENARAYGAGLVRID